jgi:hypothetical protein
VNPRIPRRLIPEPVGFDDEVKRHAAHMGRALDATTGLCGAAAAATTAAVAVGAVVPPIGAVMAVVAAGSFFFRLRAKWAEEDPPRGDFEEPAELTHREIDPWPLMLEGSHLPSGALIVALELAAKYVETTVVSLEKAIGAEIEARNSLDQRTVQLAVQRRSEASYYAQESEPILVALQEASLPFIRLLEELPTSFSQPLEQGKTLLRSLDSGTLGRVLAAGVDPKMLRIQIDQAQGPETPELVDAVRAAGERAAEFGRALGRWGSGGGGSWPAGLYPIGVPPGFSFTPGASEGYEEFEYTSTTSP